MARLDVNAVADEALGVAEKSERRKRRALTGADLGATKGAARADSLQSMLAQALTSDDRDLLETVLNTRDPQLIANTVRRLPPTHVLPCSRAVVSRFRAKPN